MLTRFKRRRRENTDDSRPEPQLLPAKAMDREASNAESSHRSRSKLFDAAHNKPAISTVSMLAAIKKQGFNGQPQSPLFGGLPAELRTAVFAYVLAERDGATAIPEDKIWYRPDYTRYRYIDTALLRTCRAIWLETFAIPRRNVSFRMWLGSTDRQAPRRKCRDALHLSFCSVC